MNIRLEIETDSAKGRERPDPGRARRMSIPTATQNGYRDSRRNRRHSEPNSRCTDGDLPRDGVLILSIIKAYTIERPITGLYVTLALHAMTDVSRRRATSERLKSAQKGRMSLVGCRMRDVELASRRRL